MTLLGLIAYVGVGLLTLVAIKYLPPRMEFVKGTPAWRRLFTIVFVVLLWPVFWIVMMFSRVEVP